MSAPTTGAQAPRTTATMLAQIGCGTAAETVMSLRYTTSPPGPTFIASLDAALSEARPHRGGSTLQRGDMIELIGPSGSGKTSMISFLLLTACLPESMPIDLPPPSTSSVTVALGGKAQNAVLLCPTTHRSPLPALAAGMRDHIQSCILDALERDLRPKSLTQTLHEAVEEVVKESLARIRVVRFRPRWASLYLALLTILNPPEMVLHPSTWADRGRAVDMVLIDGFADGFWPERWAGEERGTRKGTVRGIEDIGMRDVVAAMDGLRRDLGAVVVVSLQALWPKGNLYDVHLPPPYPNPFNREDQLPRPWPLNIQITLRGRVRPLQLPPDLTLVDALRTLELNSEGRSQRFEGVVRVPSGRGEAATLNGKKIEWAIGPCGLEIEPAT